MQRQPLVSIIIPVYNRENIVRRALDAAISQTYNNIEIIVCDNASTDNTWITLQNYASKDSRIHIFRNANNVGPVRNWIECLNHVSGEYTKILWSDDSISFDYIEKTLPILERHNNVGFVYTKTRIITPTVDNYYYCWGGTGQYETSSFAYASLFGQKETPVSPGCALFRTKDVKQNLLIEIPNEYGMDFARYGAGNDLLLFLCPCAAYSNFYYVDEPLSTFYGGSDSFTMNNNLGRYYQYAKYYYVRNFGSETLKSSFYSRYQFGFLHKAISNETYRLQMGIVAKSIINAILHRVGINITIQNP